MPYAVTAYITSAYWFTASTSFANPAVTLARSLTDGFSGIRPSNVVAFVAAQAIGGLIAAKVFGGSAFSFSYPGEMTRTVRRPLF